MDVGFRGSAVAVGAATFNMRVAAAAHSVLSSVSFDEDDTHTALRGTMVWGRGDDPRLAKLYQPMLLRQTNRHRGTAAVVEPATANLLEAVTASEGARVHLVTDREKIAAISDILAHADRIRYLTPRLHADRLLWGLAAFALAVGYGHALLVGTVLAALGTVALVIQHTHTIPITAELRLGTLSALDLARQALTVAAIVVLALTILGIRLLFSRRLGGASGYALAGGGAICELMVLATLAALRI